MPQKQEYLYIIATSNLSLNPTINRLLRESRGGNLYSYLFLGIIAGVFLLTNAFTIKHGVDIPRINYPPIIDLFDSKKNCFQTNHGGVTQLKCQTQRQSS